MNPLLLRRLERALATPRPFQPGTRDMWTDPYISRRALDAHFDSSHDDASRKPETVDRSVGWINHATRDAPGRRLVDLGCGPGLYAERFARLGWEVLGIDVSAPAIACARRRARGAGQDIVYRRADYRAARWPGERSLVTLIYGGFCVIPPRDRDRLMDRVLASLSPGGYFVLDVFTTVYTQEERSATEWYLKPGGGFWDPGRHLVLEDTLDYDDDLMLNRYVVVPSLGRTRRYHLWYQPYTPDGIRELLARAGFVAVELHGDLTGAPLDPEGPWIGVVARRPYE